MFYIIAMHILFVNITSSSFFLLYLIGISYYPPIHSFFSLCSASSKTLLGHATLIL